MTDKPSRRTVLTALGVAPLAAAAVPSVAHATGSRVPAELRPGGEFDRFVADLAAQGRFSGTVLLAQRGKPVLQRSHGMADRARNIPNGPDTIFTHGSITKMFTAIAVNQLAEQGKLSYGQKAGAYVDFLRPEVAEARIHHLLTHSSGLGDFHSQEYFEQAANWRTVEELWQGTLTFVGDCPLSFVPGAGQQYSNAAYVVLGAIVAQVSGQTYYDYVREHVFARAGMTDAAFLTTPEQLANRQCAHTYVGDTDTTDGPEFVGLPPGGACTTAPDLVAFARAVQGNRLLNEPFTTIATSPKLPLSPDNAGWETYGMGMFHRNGRWALGHNGGNTTGVSCNVDWFPATDWAAVVLGNAGDRTAVPITDKARDLITRLT